MSAVGYYQLGEMVESNIINSLCDGGVGYPIDKTLSDNTQGGMSKPHEELSAHVTSLLRQ
jgi:hypothetical protein